MKKNVLMFYYGKFQTHTKVKKVVKINPPIPPMGSNYYQHFTILTSSIPLIFWGILRQS